jgi:glycosyltransferase involved in cell wall biosynthesis
MTVTGDSRVAMNASGAAADIGRLRVCVDARLVSGAGGTEQFILNLARALCRLPDGDEEYLFLCYEGLDDWIAPFVSGPGRLVHVPAPVAQPSAVPRWRRIAKRVLPFVPSVIQWWRHNHATPIPASDGVVESLAPDVLHFTKQDGFRTSVPTIFHPHDLQHVHLPQYFGVAEARERDLRYRQLCEQASTVLVASRWVRNDVIDHFGLPPEKVAVVNLAPFGDAHATPSPEEAKVVSERLHLPDRFVFYPAQTWPHKNHMGLLEALAVLKRDHGLEVPLVCTGTKNAYFAEIEARVLTLDLGGQVKFLGFVSPEDLVAIFASSEAVVVPTRFEAGSGPVWEAFAAGVPVACSNVTSLPDQVGDAALLFDPDDTAQIAEAIRALWVDAHLRDTLIARGRANVARYDWAKSARLFRAHYRRIAGRSEQADVELLSQPSLY